MAARRIRAARPLAPHGLPGHLVGFVEALRGSGISVGPSETVDAGRVMATLGLGDREVLREGIACAVLRRPDHRDTYDAMFDLWFPAALGARAVITTEDESAGSGGLPPDDVEAMRQLLLDLLANNQDLAGKDERLVEMIARIVEAYGKYSSSRGPSFSSYQALKAMALDELEGKLLAGLLAPYGDEPTATQEQIAKALAAQKIAQLRRMVDAETKRRTAEQLGREHVQMYGIPQLSENVEFLRASGEQLRQMRRVVAPLARTLATRLAARRRRARAGSIDLRKTLRKSMSTGGVPIDLVLHKPRPARPELVVVRRVGLGRGLQPLHAAAGTRAAPTVLPGSRLRLHRLHRRGDPYVRAGIGPGHSDPADHPGGWCVCPRRPFRLRQRVRLVHAGLPKCAVAAQLAAGAW